MSSIYDKASLVLIPSGTKTSKVYSQKPTNGDGDFTFSRSTAATRVNASGNIEKETQNLLLQSNTFDTTWTQSDIATLTSGQSGYDGNSDAWLVEKSASSNGYLRQNISSSGVHTFSLYAKSDTLNGVLIQTRGASTKSAQFDLSTGTLGTASNNIDAKIEDVGSGWYRCSVSVNDSAITQVRVFICDDGTTIGTTAGSIYIQDTQLEQGLVARSYNETTTSAFEGGITDNVPRLDYTDSSCPALLLEPQRTNLATSSEYFEQVFTEASGVSWEHNSTTSPEGVNNASKLSNTSNNNGAYYVSMSFTDNDTITASIFAKQGSRDVLQFGVSNQNESRSYYYRFNLSEGTASYYANNGGMLNGTGSIEDYGNGWYRCIVTATFPSSGTTSGGVFPRVVATGNLYLYGLQVEKNASYATSYIPTYGSAVTRNQDFQTLDITNFVSATEGTLFFELKDARSHSITNKILGIGDGSGVDNFFGLYVNNFSTGAVSIRNRQANSDLMNTTIPNPNNAKVAIKFGASGVKTFLNGSEFQSSSTAYTGWASSFDLQTSCGDLNLKQYMLFPTALTDQEAIDLTTI